MLTITLKNKAIPLPRNFSMNLTIQSPVCDFEKIPMSYSLDFNLPINRFTSAILGHPERVTKYSPGNDLHIPGLEVRFDGALLIAGTLTVAVDRDNYNCSIIDKVGELSEREQSRNILEIPEFDQLVLWNNIGNYTPDEYPYCFFPLINPGFFRGKGQVVTRKVGAEEYDTEILTYCFDKTSIFRVNATNEGGTLKALDTDIPQTSPEYEAARLYVLTPFFWLKNIVNMAIKANNMHVKTSVLNSSSSFKNLCIYNNFDITSTELNFLGETIYEEHYYELNENNEPMMVSDIRSKGHKINTYHRSYGPWIRIKNHLPKMTVGELLVSTQNLVNVVFDFLPNNTVDVHSREDLLAMPSKNIQKYMIGSWMKSPRKQVALKFVREHDKTDGVFAERYTDLSDRLDDIKEPVASWSALDAIANPEEGEIRFLQNPGVFVEFKWLNKSETEEQTGALITNDLLGWEEISIGLQTGWHEYGRSEVEEIKTKWSTCYGTASETLTNQPGKMQNWKNKEEDISPRLLIYKGNNTGGNQAPGFSFEYGGENGLLKNCWARTAKWWANRQPVTGNFQFTANALRSIIWNKCLPYRTDEMAVMIEKISVPLYVDHIGIAEVTAYKRE